MRAVALRLVDAEAEAATSKRRLAEAEARLAAPPPPRSSGGSRRVSDSGRALPPPPPPQLPVASSSLPLKRRMLQQPAAGGGREDGEEGPVNIDEVISQVWGFGGFAKWQTRCVHVGRGSCTLRWPIGSSPRPAQ